MRMADLIAETCTVTGTSNPYTLTGALSAGYRRFRANYADGKAGLVYVAKTTQASPNGAKIEIGRLATLTYGSPNDSLSRGTIMLSSNSNAAVDWLASDIVVVYQAPLLDVMRILQPDFIAGPATISSTDTMTVLGQVLEYDVTSGNGALTISSAGAAFGHGFSFDVYPYGSTSNSLIITPPSGQSFNEQAVNATVSVTGGKRKRIHWNDTRSVWIVSDISSASADLTTQNALDLNGGLFSPFMAGKAKNIDLNATGDTTLTLTLPTGAIGYRVQTIWCYAPTGSAFSTARFGIYTGPGATGTTIMSSAAPAPSASGVNAAGAIGTQTVASLTTVYTATTLYINVGTPQGSAATMNIYFIVHPVM